MNYSSKNKHTVTLLDKQFILLSDEPDFIVQQGACVADEFLRNIVQENHQLPLDRALTLALLRAACHFVDMRAKLELKQSTESKLIQSIDNVIMQC